MTSHKRQNSNLTIVSIVVLSWLSVVSISAQNSRPASDAVATVVVIHRGGGLIDIAAREGVWGVITTKTHLSEEVAVGRVTVSARGILGYGQQFMYEVFGMTGEIPQFFHSKAHELLYEPVASVGGTTWSAGRGGVRTIPYVSLSHNGTTGSDSQLVGYAA